MPIEQQITITTTPGGGSPRISFDPNPLVANEGDQIFWTNNDTQPHWPGRVMGDGSINKTFFMPNQIAPNGDVSPIFSTVVTADSSAPLKYACSLHPEETGSITIS